MQHILSKMRKAIEDYNMIDEGDKIAVCLSGGKDSITMLNGLKALQRFYPKHFDLIAITVNPGFENFNKDILQKNCDEIGVPLFIEDTQIKEIVFDVRKEKNPCSLCAKMRRGILHDTAKEYGCNKIALGHHLDDAAETFMMNLLNGGTIKCFSPVSFLSRKELYLIRPLIFAYEKDVKRAAASLDLPIVKSKCPADGVTERQSTKELLASLERQYPALREKIVGALQRGGISGW